MNLFFPSRARAFITRALLTCAALLLSSALAPSMATTITTASLSAGHSHTCAVNKAGQAMCWGSNADGELGDGTRTDRTGPVAVQGLPASVAAIQAGRGFSCALLQDQSLHCKPTVRDAKHVLGALVQD